MKSALAVVMVVACAGCFGKPQRFVAGDGGVGDGGVGDGASIDAPACLTYSAWTPKGSVTGFNTTDDEFGPWLSPDGLDLYFTRAGQVVRGHRGTRGATFDSATTPQLGLPMLGSGSDHQVFLSDDQLRIWFNNGSGAIATAERTSPGVSTWSSTMVLSDLQGAMAQLEGVYVSSDGLAMFLAGGPNHNGEAILRSTRTITSDPFNAAMKVDANLDDATSNDSQPSATANEQLLVWQRDITSTPTLMFSERLPGGSYSAPMPITAGLTAGELRRSPHITRDGLTMVFETEMNGDSDLKLVERTCTDP